MTDYGLSLDGQGNIGFDPSGLIGTLPPDAIPLANTINTAAHSSNPGQVVFQATLQTAAALAATVGFPEGLILAGAIELLAAVGWAHGVGDCCVNATCPPHDPHEWEYRHGSYDPGPDGSFLQFANNAIRAAYEGVAQTLDPCKQYKVGAYGMLPVFLGTAIKAWNTSHQGPAGAYSILANTAVKGGFQAGVPADSTPVSVACNVMAIATPNAPVPSRVVFMVNGGPSLGYNANVNAFNANLPTYNANVNAFNSNIPIPPKLPSSFDKGVRGPGSSFDKGVRGPYSSGDNGTTITLVGLTALLLWALFPNLPGKLLKRK